MRPAKVSASATRPLDWVVEHLRRVLVGSADVRQPLPADLKAIYSLVNSIRLEHGYSEPMENHISIEQFHDYYDGQNGVFVLLEVQGRPVGTIAAHVLPNREVEIQRFYIAAEQRGRGLGATVCTEMVNAFFKVGCEAVVLETNAHFKAAGRLYRSMGFVRTGESLPDTAAGNYWLRLKRH